MYVCACMCVHVCVHVCVCIYVCMYDVVMYHECVCVCMHHVCVCVCVCVCARAYTHTSEWECPRPDCGFGRWRGEEGEGYPVVEGVIVLTPRVDFLPDLVHRCQFIMYYQLLSISLIIVLTPRVDFLPDLVHRCQLFERVRGGGERERGDRGK